MKNKVRSAVIRKIIIAYVIIIALEVFVFNYKSLTGAFSSCEVSFGELKYDNEKACIENDKLVIKDKTGITISNVPEWARVVSINCSLPEDCKPVKLILSMEDENFSKKFNTAATILTYGKGNDCYLSFSPYGSAKALRICFDNIDKKLQVNEIVLLSKIPFSLSLVRVFALFVIATVVIIIREYRLFTITFDFNNSNHKIAYICVATVCVLSILCLAQKVGAIKYPWDGDANGKDPYAQTFDALYNGRVYLDITPDEKLSELENPYDNSLRADSEVTYKWDRAYYNGKYYSYFGITPVITLAYPLYLMTGYIPAKTLYVTIYALFGSVFMMLTIYKVLRIFVKKPNLLLVLLALPVAQALGGAVYVLQYADIYNVAVSGGLCFLYMSLFFGMSAYLKKPGLLQYIDLVLSGVALILCVGSKPSIATGGLLLAPLYISFLLKKNAKLKTKLTQATCFLVPVFIGLGLLMVYNALRFDDPFCFGAQYQLTVSDIHANSLSLFKLPAAFFHYYLQFPGNSNVFPYIELVKQKLDNYGAYVYIEKCIGLLWFPVISVGLIFVRNAFSRTVCGKNQETLLVQRGFMAVALSLSIFLCWFMFCEGGVNMRYYYDFMTPLLLICICSLLRVSAKPDQIRYKIFTAAFIMTVVFVFIIVLSDYERVFDKFYARLYDDLRSLIIFWR